MKIAILGFAGQGQSAYEYWSTSGNDLTICDMNSELKVPDGAKTQLGQDYLKNLDQFDVLVRTPILHPRDIVAANPENPNILDKVTSNTNEFFNACPSKNIIGVTGTKGKGTTSTLITRMLQSAGKRVHLGGNIGIPPLELLKDDIQPDDWVVLELANFQLIDLKYSPHIAVCLMISAEHLDWHEDVEEYIAAKQQLFIHQTSDDVAIYYAKNEISESIADASEGEQIPYFDIPGAIIKGDSVVIHNQEICKISEIKLLGKHNWQNVCAAITAVWQVTQDVAAIKKAVTNFSGLPFRIEFRREVNGIRYYNDSFASQPSATIAAIGAIPGNKVVIIGGHERGLDLTEFCKSLNSYKSEIRKIVVIGTSGDRIVQNLKKFGFKNYVQPETKTMEGVVAAGSAEAQVGDAVILSPGFASFDMFKNFEDRGKQFNQVVDAL
jgi:UDP-N-acetylmuramoylalanine--D-glutamate ligase